ncbi:MAG: ATP-binding protein [Neptuniibacter sp.]
MSNPETEILVSELTINNELSEVPKMNQWLKENLNKCQVSPEVLFRFDLGANEAIINIISYAFQDQKNHQISLKLLAQGDIASLLITDYGYPFNPLEASDPEIPISVEAAEIGGLGIKLIKNFIDNCEYSRSDDRNILRLTNNI